MDGSRPNFNFITVQNQDRIESCNDQWMMMMMMMMTRDGSV